jgi:hypothetical protein
VHQVGFITCIYRDVRSAKHKNSVTVLAHLVHIPLICLKMGKTEYRTNIQHLRTDGFIKMESVRIYDKGDSTASCSVCFENCTPDSITKNVKNKYMEMKQKPLRLLHSVTSTNTAALYMKRRKLYNY